MVSPRRTVSYVTDVLVWLVVSDVLGIRKKEESETNVKIVDLFKHVLDEIKNCRTDP